MNPPMDSSVAVDATGPDLGRQDAGTSDSGMVRAAPVYLKASNPGAGDWFGWITTYSNDGQVLAVGAPREDGSGRGIGAPSDRSAANAGAVYMFRRDGMRWVLDAYIKAPNADAGDEFGVAIALSADGSTLAVGANLEDGGGTSVLRTPPGANNEALDSGAVYVYRRDASAWSLESYLKATNSEAGDHFGLAVSLSGDGNTIAVGSLREDGAALGATNPVPGDNAAMDSGAAYVFRRTAGTWSAVAYLKSLHTRAFDAFSIMLALSADGRTLAVGAQFEDGAGSGPNPVRGTSEVVDSGAVYVFYDDRGTWRPQAYLKASNTGSNDWFGHTVSLSQDGNVLGISAMYEDGSRTSRVGAYNDDSPNSGAAYVFRRAGSSWSFESYVKADEPTADDIFGWAIAMSPDGTKFAVGAPAEDGSGAGLDPMQHDDSLNGAGAAYVFEGIGGSWTLQHLIKSPWSREADAFGQYVAFADSPGQIVVGAVGEDSSSSGVSIMPELLRPSYDSGAAYVYDLR